MMVVPGYISPKEWKEKRGIDLDLVSKVIDELIDKEGWEAVGIIFT